MSAKNIILFIGCIEAKEKERCRVLFRYGHSAHPVGCRHISSMSDHP